jgi:hypothetical protein
VKGAHSDNVNREISVSAYEVVTGQAVKNLVWLDKQTLMKGLVDRARAAHFFWHNGLSASPATFMKAVEKSGCLRGASRAHRPTEPTLVARAEQQA